VLVTTVDGLRASYLGADVPKESSQEKIERQQQLLREEDMPPT